MKELRSDEMRICCEGSLDSKQITVLQFDVLKLHDLS